jgi:hypothetical protein
MEWLGNVEPSLDDVLSDPLILSIIAISGRSPDDVRRLVACLAQSVREWSRVEIQARADRVHPSRPDVPPTPLGTPHAAKPVAAPTSTNVLFGACSAGPSVSLSRKVPRLICGALSHE